MDGLSSVFERRFAVASAAATGMLVFAYAVTLIIGLATAHPGAPVRDPWFALLELQILALAPLMTAFIIAIRQWSRPRHQLLGTLAIVFIAMAALLTSAAHVVILAVARSPAFAADAGLLRQLAFEWPSVVYALDILAWDFFFALSVLCTAPLFRDFGEERWIGRLLVLSGALALAGLIGAGLGDMGWRNIGIVGYAGVFPVAAALTARLFVNSGPLH